MEDSVLLLGSDRFAITPNYQNQYVRASRQKSRLNPMIFEQNPNNHMIYMGIEEYQYFFEVLRGNTGIFKIRSNNILH